MATDTTDTTDTTKRKRAKRKTLTERWVEYHQARPDTYRAFATHAARLRRRGHKHLSAQYILDYLSFETPHDMRPALSALWAKREPAAPVKIDHDFGPFYARTLIAADPSFASLFERRKSVADGLDYASLVPAA